MPIYCGCLCSTFCVRNIITFEPTTKRFDELFKFGHVFDLGLECCFDVSSYNDSILKKHFANINFLFCCMYYDPNRFLAKPMQSATFFAVRNGILIVSCRANAV